MRFGAQAVKKVAARVSRRNLSPNYDFLSPWLSRHRLCFQLIDGFVLQFSPLFRTTGRSCFVCIPQTAID
jgi:hypothetical protein